MKKENKQTRLTFSKKIIIAVILLAEIDIQLIFLLSFLDKCIPENMGIAITTEIIGVVLVYCIKAYFETKAEKKQEFEEYKFDQYIRSDEDNRGE